MQIVLCPISRSICIDLTPDKFISFPSITIFNPYRLTQPRFAANTTGRSHTALNRIVLVAKGCVMKNTKKKNLRNGSLNPFLHRNGRNRTCDRSDISRVLCQLSYVPLRHIKMPQCRIFIL